MGNMIAQRDIEKVFPADEYSAVGIAGTAGLAVEMVKLFQLELEHFEKVEGAQLSLEGKANRLSTMIRATSAWPCRAWPWCRCSRGSTWTAEGPHLLLRRHRRPLRGARVRRHRLRLDLRARRDEEALPR